MHYSIKLALLVTTDGWLKCITFKTVRSSKRWFVEKVTSNLTCSGSESDGVSVGGITTDVNVARYSWQGTFHAGWACTRKDCIWWDTSASFQPKIVPPNQLPANNYVPLSAPVCGDYKTLFCTKLILLIKIKFYFMDSHAAMMNPICFACTSVSAWTLSEC